MKAVVDSGKEVACVTEGKVISNDVPRKKAEKYGGSLKQRILEQAKNLCWIWKEKWKIVHGFRKRLCVTK